jgi:hypothetical protein
MSKVKIQGNAAGTGIFTVAAPATNTDRTITLPDVSATVLTTAGGNISGGLGVSGNLDLSGTGDVVLGRTDGYDSSIVMSATAVNAGKKLIFQKAGGGSLAGIEFLGSVLKPTQPFFTARQPANQTSTGGTGYYFHNFSDVIQNVGSHFNNSTGRFTAPITGVYLFRGIVMGVESGDNSPHCGFSINGSANTGGGSYASNAMWEHPTGAAHKTDTMHIIKLNANDNIRFIQLSSVLPTQTDRTFFMGYLLG